VPNENGNGAPAVRSDVDIIAWLYEDAGHAFEIVSARAVNMGRLVREVGPAGCIADGEEFDRLSRITCELRGLAAEAHRAA